MNREAALRALMIEGAKEWRRRVIGEAPHAKVDLLPPPLPSPEQAAAQGTLVSAGKERRGDRRKDTTERTSGAAKPAPPPGPPGAPGVRRRPNHPDTPARARRPTDGPAASGVWIQSWVQDRDLYAQSQKHNPLTRLPANSAMEGALRGLVEMTAGLPRPLGRGTPARLHRQRYARLGASRHPTFRKSRST